VPYPGRSRRGFEAMISNHWAVLQLDDQAGNAQQPTARPLCQGENEQLNRTGKADQQCAWYNAGDDGHGRFLIDFAG